MRWQRAFPLLLLVAWLPLFAPEAWRLDGAYPDLAVLVVLHVALRRGREDAAFAGITIGLLRSPFTAAALGLDAFLLGGAGFVVGHLRRQLHADRWHVQAVLIAATCLAVRLVPLLIGRSGGAFWSAVPPALLSAIATVLAALPVLAVLRALRLLRGDPETEVAHV